MICRQCKASIPDGSRFCEFCGSPLEADRPASPVPNLVCPGCQAPITQGSRFCETCGHRLEITGPTPNEVPAVSPSISVSGTEKSDKGAVIDTERNLFPEHIKKYVMTISALIIGSFLMWKFYYVWIWGPLTAGLIAGFIAGKGLVRGAIVGFLCGLFVIVMDTIIYDFFNFGIIYPAIFGLIGGAIGGAARLGMSKFTVMIPLMIITVVSGGLPPQILAQKPVLSTPPPRGYQLMETESESRKGWRFYGWRLEQETGRIKTEYRLYSGNPAFPPPGRPLGSCVIVKRLYYAKIFPPARRLGQIRGTWGQEISKDLSQIPIPLHFGGIDVSRFTYDHTSFSYSAQQSQQGTLYLLSLQNDHLVYAYADLQTKDHEVDYSGPYGTVPTFDQTPYWKTLRDDMYYYMSAEPWGGKPERGDRNTVDKPPVDSTEWGTLTALDAMNALKMSVGILPVDLVADMDRDGRVTSRDATIILRHVVGR